MSDDVLPRLRPVCLCADIRAIEQRAFAQDPPPPLMERAGLAAAVVARDMLANGRRVLLVAGPGNNGGDAFVVARLLKSWWFDVTVAFAGEEDELGRDAAAALAAWRSADGTTITAWPDDARVDLVVDGLFGIGLERAVHGIHAEWIARINAMPCPVLALDIPSGLHADSGRVLGTAVRATATATFLAFKPGLLTLEGPDHVGRLHVFDLGVDVGTPATAQGRVLDANVIRAALRPRAVHSHKGTYGDVGIIGGAAGMTGAALLAGRAASKLGAGRALIGFLDAGAPALDLLQPELMLRTVAEVVAMDALAVLVAGPGLGRSDAARTALAQAIDRKAALVLDADALNLVAGDSALADAISRRTAPTLMTPHPAEAGRLLGVTTTEVQRDRVASARRIAERFNAHVVLKGAGSICAAPSGEWFVNTSGNPGMASAGMGDVLTGIVAALVAQGASPLLALLAGVHLHGLAGDRLRKSHRGPVGMSASEIVDAARAELNEALYPAG